MNRFSCLRQTILFAFLMFVPVLAVGQNGIIAIDNVSCRYGLDSIVLPSNMVISLRFTNNTVNKVDISNGFRISSPDGAIWDSTTIAPTGAGTFGAYFDIVFYSGMYSGNGFDSDTAGILGVGTPIVPLRQMPAGYDGVPFKITLWNISEINDGKHVCIDTSFYQPGGTWKWVSVVDGNETTYKPDFLGLSGHAYTPGAGYCFYLYHMPCGVAREQALSAVANPTACPCSHCCIGTTGNVNESGIVDLSDLSSLVSYLTGGGYVPNCDEEANVNSAGIIDLSDLSSLVSYLTGGGYLLPTCP